MEMRFKIVFIFYTTLSLLRLLSVSAGDPSRSVCGGLIELNGTTLDLHYKIPFNSTNETIEDSSTCVWVISTKIEGSIGFNLTRLDLDTHNRPPGSSVTGVLSVQRELKIHQNDTLPLSMDSEDIGREIIVNETWTLLVFRHFSSDARISGKGFQVTLRGVQTPEFVSDPTGVHAEFLGGREGKDKDSRFLAPLKAGQPGVFIVNSRHGKGLEVTVWTLLMEKGELANFYKFSKALNKFIFVRTLVHMPKSFQFYGYLQGEEDQPILFYFHTNANALPTPAGNPGSLCLSYAYTSLTSLTSNSTDIPMNGPSVSLPTTISPQGSHGTRKKGEVNGSSGEVIVIWVGFGVVMLFLFLTLGLLLANHFKGRGLCLSRINFVKFWNGRRDGVSLTESQEVYNL